MKGTALFAVLYPIIEVARVISATVEHNPVGAVVTVTRSVILRDFDPLYRPIVEILAAHPDHVLTQVPVEFRSKDFSFGIAEVFAFFIGTTCGEDAPCPACRSLYQHPEEVMSA